MGVAVMPGSTKAAHAGCSVVVGGVVTGGVEGLVVTGGVVTGGV